jgi:23S rRNA pseudouridine2605 synthase
MANHNSKGSFGRKPADRPSGPRSYSAKPERTSGEGKKIFNRNDKSRSSEGRDRKPYGDAPARGGFGNNSRSERPYNADRSFSKDRPSNSERPYNADRSYSKSRPSNSERPYNAERSFSKGRPSNSDRPYNSERSFSKDRPANSDRSFNKSRSGGSDRPYDNRNSDRPYRSSEGGKSEYRPSRPVTKRDPDADKPWVARATRSEFGSVPRGGKGERNRSFKPEKEQYRTHLEEGKTDAPRRDEDGFAPREAKREFSERPSNRTFSNDRPARSFDGDRKPYAKKSYGSDDKKSYGSSERGFSKDRSFSKDDRSTEGSRFSKERRASRENQNAETRAPRPAQGPREEGAKPGPRANRSYNDYLAGEEKRASRNERPEKPSRFEDRRGRTTSESVGEAPNYSGLKRYSSRDKNRSEDLSADGQLRLNRYIANAGICSRREADELITAGEIKVNGEVITELGYKVQPTDSVQYGKKNLSREKLVYVLLNKPKDFITTTEDPEGRKTVMDLVANASKERIFPVGRLDRNTTGLLLFTNDGELAQKLTHPSHKNSKIYQVEVDKPLTKEDFEKIQNGLELEDGKADVDDLAMIGNSNKFVGIEIHIGRNRIVRRIFESLGYEVVTLDRVQYAGLTKKDLPRGNWRFLSEKEVIRLKYFLK